MGKVFSYISRKLEVDTCNMCERKIIDTLTAKCRVCNETNHLYCYKNKIANKHFGYCLTCSGSNCILIIPHASMMVPT